MTAAERARKWRQDHPGAKHQWYLANREHVREWAQTYWRTHKAERQAYNRAYQRKPRPTKVRVPRGRSLWALENARHSKLRYKREHPEQARNDLKRRRALKKGSSVLERLDAVEIYERDHWACQLCSLPVDAAAPHLGDRPSMDHIIPLSLGGQHSWANVQLAHHRCNARKGARMQRPEGVTSTAEDAA